MSHVIKGIKNGCPALWRLDALRIVLCFVISLAYVQSLRPRHNPYTPQTVMRVEFHPASNMAEHGKWRLYGMPIDNIELV